MWKKILLIGSIVVGIGLFCAIPFIVGVDETFRAIGDVGWLCIVLFCASGLMVQVAPAAGWTIIMRAEGMKVSFLDAVKSNLMGFPLVFITPSMYLGGEPIKVFYLAKKYNEPKRRVLATIIVSKFQELTAIVVVAIVAAGIFLWRTDFFTKRNEALLVIAMVVLVILMGLMLAAFLGNFKITVKAINLLARLGFARRKLARLRSKAEEMEQLIHVAFTKRWRSFLAAQAVTFLSSAAVLVRPWMFFYLSKNHLDLGSEHICAIYVITNLLNMLTILPGGLGIFEGGMVGYFAAAKLGDHNAAAFSIVTRISDLLLVVLGLWVIVHLGLSKFAKGVAKGEEKVSEDDVHEAVRSATERYVVKPPGEPERKRDGGTERGSDGGNGPIGP